MKYMSTARPQKSLSMQTYLSHSFYLLKIVLLSDEEKKKQMAWLEKQNKDDSNSLTPVQRNLIISPKPSTSLRCVAYVMREK